MSKYHAVSWHKHVNIQEAQPRKASMQPLMVQERQLCTAAYSTHKCHHPKHDQVCACAGTHESAVVYM